MKKLTKFQAKSTKGYKFNFQVGYVSPSDFGIFDTVAGEFIRFLDADTQLPYMPQGGKKACTATANAWNTDSTNLSNHITTVSHREE